MKIVKSYLKGYIQKIKNKILKDEHIKKPIVIIGMDFIQKYTQKRTR